MPIIALNQSLNEPLTHCTSVDGFGKTWKLVMDRFFSRYQYAASIEINDFGATPGAVSLRLEQAVERSLV
jgi:malonate decarboxylase delta subunit